MIISQSCLRWICTKTASDESFLIHLLSGILLWDAPSLKVEEFENGVRVVFLLDHPWKKSVEKNLWGHNYFTVSFFVHNLWCSNYRWVDETFQSAKALYPKSVSIKITKNWIFVNSPNFDQVACICTHKARTFERIFCLGSGKRYSEACSPKFPGRMKN